MSDLVIATSDLADQAEEEIENGLHYKIDYLELGRGPDTAIVNYSTRGSYPALIERVEQRAKLDVYWAWQLAQRVRRESRDSVFSMSERVGIPLTFMLPPEIRHVVMLHHPLSRRKLQFLKWTGVARRWEKALFFSRAEREAARRVLELPKEKVGTLHFAIDTDFFQPLTQPPRQNGGRFIFSIGLSHRDYPTLLNAMAQLPNVQCQICGTSAWVDHSAGYEGVPFPQNVVARHYDHPNIIRQVYWDSEFVVIPIQPDTTQWSAGAASVVQPQAMGRAVIASRMPGLSEYVNDGVTGILVEPGNPEAMAEAIHELWDHPEKAREMGQAGIQWVREKFSLENWVCEIKSILQAEPAS